MFLCCALLCRGRVKWKGRAKLPLAVFDCPNYEYCRREYRNDSVGYKTRNSRVRFRWCKRTADRRRNLQRFQWNSLPFGFDECAWNFTCRVNDSVEWSIKADADLHEIVLALGFQVCFIEEKLKSKVETIFFKKIYVGRVSCWCADWTPSPCPTGWVWPTSR